jgi:outer membrane protein assembly factor BamB
MSQNAAVELHSPQTASTPSASPRRAKGWPAAVLVAAYWSSLVVMHRLDLAIYAGFFAMMAAGALFFLAFSIWWLASPESTFKSRLLTWLAFLAICVATVLLSDKSVGPIGLMLFGLPCAMTAAVAWLLIARWRSLATRRAGMILACGILCGSMTLVRVNGVDGNQNASVNWRWSQTAEQAYLAERAVTSPAAASESSPKPISEQPGDWTEFRGPSGHGEVLGIKIATDWAGAPPKPLWRHRVGPAWSSVLVVGGRLFTQEQRDQEEAVVCLDAQSGREIWNHSNRARFFDGQAGAGPRSSPVFADGRVFALGGTGILDCLDAATGHVIWSHNIVDDSGAAVPMWGFSNSPLVSGGIVVVYAGADNGKGLLAYQASGGKPAWTAPTGSTSYSSPQLVSIRGQPQILFLSDEGLVSVDAASGKVLWNYSAAAKGIWRVAMPRQVGDGSILIGSEDLGLVRLDVTREGGQWTLSRKWGSQAIRPAFNDFVFLDGFVYGFDESIFCCIDAQTGERRWKGGRYGHGQVLLLPEQKLLLVISEKGEAVLVAANPERHQELARFQAIEGKTWNHPVLAHGRLYIRNAEEIACYDLKTR